MAYKPLFILLGLYNGEWSRIATYSDRYGAENGLAEVRDYRRRYGYTPTEMKIVTA
jgi:hypothetical protein